MTKRTSEHEVGGDRYIAPGTPVCIDWVDEEGKPSPEFGVMIHCWLHDDLGVFDCYFASFGDELPKKGPSESPAILRYTAASFRVVAD
ncbi:MAG: hypothetical protein ABJP70_10905 [Erythrobacter sp.]